MDDVLKVSLAIDQIKATNRTTHAIRALVKFLLFEATYGVVALIFIGWGISPTLSLKQPSLGFIVLGVVIAVVGLMHSFVAAYKELSESNVPTVVRPRTQKPNVTAPKMRVNRYTGDDTGTRMSWPEED